MTVSRLRLMLLAALLMPGRALGLAEVCTVSSAPVAFGGYSIAAGASLDAAGAITVTCTAVLSIAVNYTIRLGPGAGASFSPRRMAGAGSLAYNLFTNASRTTIWGDGSSGTTTVADGYALGLLLVSRSYPVYGRIPAGQNVAPGAYADIVFVTVDY